MVLKNLPLLLVLLATACSAGLGPVSYPTASSAEIATAEALLGFKFNRDYERRDDLLGINEKWGTTDIGGIAYFEELDAEVLEVLLKERFVAPDMRHNEAPPASEFLRFLQDHPQATAGGYAVSPLRADYAVLLTSIHIEGRFMSASRIEAIRQFCRYADEEQTVPEGYCWWD